jgi:hypothetical protein
MRRHGSFDGFGLFALGRGIDEDGGSVLGASVVSLAIRDGWVVRSEEEFCYM